MAEKQYSENYQKFKIWLAKNDNKVRFNEMKRNMLCLLNCSIYVEKKLCL